MKPLIGVTCAWDEAGGRLFLGRMYLEAVLAAGGTPLPLAYTPEEPSLSRIIEVVDGLILSGGADVDPVLFGEEPLPGCGEITPDRDVFEVALAGLALVSATPVLGICRGIQVLNIAAGGDIYQDIVSQAGAGLAKHFQDAPRWHPTHEINVGEGTLLASLLEPGPLRVNSFHHQAVRRAAPGFVVSARSPDGVTEALESAEHPFALGIQCHPEALWKRHPAFLGLFKGLCQAASSRRGPWSPVSQPT